MRATLNGEWNAVNRSELLLGTDEWLKRNINVLLFSREKDFLRLLITMAIGFHEYHRGHTFPTT